MAENSPKAGLYVLLGVMWRKKLDNGGTTIFRRGDEVNLTAEEAARLAGKKHSSFIPKAEAEASRPAKPPAARVEG